MLDKKILVALAAAAFCTPAFAQQTVLTAEQCVEAGGVVNAEDNTCEIDEDELAAWLEGGGAAAAAAAAGGGAASGAGAAAALGGGIGGGGLIAGGLVVVLAAGGGGSSTTTTTTTN